MVVQSGKGELVRGEMVDIGRGLPIMSNHWVVIVGRPKLNFKINRMGLRIGVVVRQHDDVDNHSTPNRNEK